MAIAHNYYPQTITTTTTTTSGWYTGYGYDNHAEILTMHSRSHEPHKPKVKTFDEELQDEIDDWLNIFKEN